MQISVSILKDPKLKGQIFEKGKMKFQDFLQDIFECSQIDVVDIHTFTMMTTITISEERVLGVKYKLSDAVEGFCREIIEILDNRDIALDDLKKIDSLEGQVEAVKEYLEKRFDLNFLPLDLEDKDPKIKDIHHSKHLWTVSFNSEKCEEEITAILRYPGSFSLVYSHYIFLD